MRRSDTLIKAIAVIVLIAIVSYFGVHIANSIINPLQTILAVNTNVTDSAEAEGYVIRQEKVLSGSGVISPVANGKKVSSGGIVAVSYSSQEALERADSIMDLKERIEHLESVIYGRGAGDINELLRKVSISLSGGDMSSLESDIFNAQYAITGKGSSSDPVTELEELKAELSKLESIQSGYTNIYAEASGLFSSSTDGFESVSPKDLNNLTPDSLQKLFDKAGKQNCFGKLVYGSKWYYAAVMDSAQAEKLTAGKSARVVFSKNYTADLSMNVESIGKVKDGKCVVVFSSGYDLTGTSSLRELSASVVFSSQSGISVPVSAIHTDEDGTEYVYLLIGLQVKRVNVKTIMQYNESYALIAAAEGTALHEGSEIIVRGKNLSDGAVVR